MMFVPSEKIFQSRVKFVILEVQKCTNPKYLPSLSYLVRAVPSQ